MTNREIRIRAWSLFREIYRAFLPAMAISAGIGFAILLAEMAFGPSCEWLTMLAQIIVWPLNACCLAAFVLSAWATGAPETARFFDPLRNFGRIRRVWAAGMVYYLPFFGFLGLGFLITWLPASGLNEAVCALIGLMVLLLLLTDAVIGCWLMLRLGLFSYAAARNPEGLPGLWLRASWRATRRNCLRTVQMYVLTAWPYLLVVFASGAMIQWAGGGSQAIRILAGLMNYAFFMLYNAYPLLVLAGLAEELLNRQSAQERAEECAENGTKEKEQDLAMTQ